MRASKSVRILSYARMSPSRYTRLAVPWKRTFSSSGDAEWTLRLSASHSGTRPQDTPSTGKLLSIMQRSTQKASIAVSMNGCHAADSSVEVLASCLVSKPRDCPGFR